MGCLPAKKTFNLRADPGYNPHPGILKMQLILLCIGVVASSCVTTDYKA